MKNTSIYTADKLASYEYQNEQEGEPKKSQGLLRSKGKKKGQEKQINEANFTRGYKSCSDTSISSQELEDSASQPNSLGEYEQLSLLKLAPTHSQSCDRTSQEHQFTQTSETTTQNQENLKSLVVDSPAQAHRTQELEQDSNIQHLRSGEKVSDALSKLNPNSVFLNNLKEFSDEDLELFLPPYIWQDTVLKLKQSRQQSLEQDTRDLDCLSFPTLTSNENSTTRPAGQTKCEKWFKDKGLVPNGSQLGTCAIASIMGYPSDWFEVLTKQYSKSATTPSQISHQEESKADTSQGEQSRQDKQRSLSVESSISIPCLIKQPHKKPFEGLIVGDRGAEFDVQVGDRIVQLPKLYVFPNPPKKKKCQTDDDISPSKSSRRKKGTGSGYINWRTIKKNGKNYKQTWFHYELWDKGRQVKSCAYIPKKMRSQIEKLNAEKVPVEEILKVLKNKNN
jgi:hypothetical protein